MGADAHTLASSYLFVSDQKAIGVLMFTRNFIVRKQSHQLLDKPDHFLVPRHVGHGEAAGRALATVGHTLRKNSSYRAFYGDGLRWSCFILTVHSLRTFPEKVTEVGLTLNVGSTNP